ncbi:unnamed protein product [Paramecium sonneborni]|uniref:Uncharacterized protein n=1 Tax=Paramecium sonneborni TaxID=65129 RepID=A0A8S1LQB7_9CILI|nr:unnamed protein product [Paramecium sonneborni]
MGASDSQIKDQLINKPEFQKYLKQICFNVPQNIINKNHYDNILGNLKQFNVIRIGSTPLGDRLFNVLNAKNNGKITSEILYQFLTQLNVNKESRCEYTFQAYSFEGQSIQSTVSEKNFIEIVVDSWERAFTGLVELLPENQKQDGDLIENWSKSENQKLLIRKAAQMSFKNFSKSQNNKVDYLTFKNWIYSEKEDKIVAKYDGKVVVVPLTLYKFTK